MQLFWQDLVNGILAGGIFAVVALGFSLVWGIMNIINLAHGAFVMLGAYTAYVLFAAWHVDPFLSIPVAFVFSSSDHLILVKMSCFGFALVP